MGLILLGRMTISRRMEAALDLAKLKNEPEVRKHTNIFNAYLVEALVCRNAVAHGTLLGANDDGDFVFLTSKSEEPEKFVALQTAVSYSADAIAGHAGDVAEFLPKMWEAFGLASLPGIRLQQTLLPHRKAQPARGSTQPQSPPRSSRAKPQPQ
jgi:hypothetical protein